MKYKVDFTSKFKKQRKQLINQGKDINKLDIIITKLASGELLSFIYKDHKLNDSKYYYNCRECHIEPDWLLIYRYDNDELILLLIATGSHSNIF